ncbi:uncharacterized protein PHALS_08606 [Plasmopara halstedii]|uniref:Uncharacterized protein n=1 Tax=Plasmopara halstedii TaxID=4781 RepID=A0A0P1ACG7_PLAHL|nr:uncharacterized protein PHALS_08606 [Plasmopara halstedii]CEG38540.1 hypothetical protein PHALS_08606 [Plasmopara halstedii]|eukprot:XP_024574909.1 hypothetical protein PHALS_08606 [Plasmopara halstedii]
MGSACTGDVFSPGELRTKKMLRRLGKFADVVLTSSRFFKNLGTFDPLHQVIHH